MCIAELSDVFNRCQAVMNTAGSKVVRNWASSRCWRSQVKPRGSKGVTRHLQRGWRGISDAYLCDTFDRGGGPKWWALGWVIDITTQKSGRPFVLCRFIEWDILYTWHLWQWWFSMFLHVLYLSLVLLAFQHTVYSASYMPLSLFRCVHKNNKG